MSILERNQQIRGRQNHAKKARWAAVSIGTANHTEVLGEDVNAAFQTICAVHDLHDYTLMFQILRQLHIRIVRTQGDDRLQHATEDKTGCGSDMQEG